MGKTTRPNPKSAPQKPAQAQNGSPEADKTAVLLKFMGSLGVSREDIEAAIGARIEEFTPVETGIIRSAAAIMKKSGTDFQTAVTEVTR
ncbi:hypothetical protein SDC9_142266 [bioreactor metagenome]|uniref:Uncharacterized protein n=1 Tax=bioreactor metagenome TaxID=1076179 RepID=A0A645E0N2_9ZZZZ